MTSWWSDLSSRERMLLTALGALMITFLILQFAWAPLNDWRDSEKSRADQARDGFELVVTAATQGQVSVSSTPRSQVPLRQALTQSASNAGIELVRVGAAVNGQIEIQPADISGDILFQWISVLRSEYGVSVAFADISRSDDGLVKAQVLVFERNE